MILGDPTLAPFHWYPVCHNPGVGVPNRWHEVAPRGHKASPIEAFHGRVVKAPDPILPHGALSPSLREHQNYGRGQFAVLAYRSSQLLGFGLYRSTKEHSLVEGLTKSLVSTARYFCRVSLLGLIPLLETNFAGLSYYLSHLRLGTINYWVTTCMLECCMDSMNGVWNPNSSEYEQGSRFNRQVLFCHIQFLT